MINYNLTINIFTAMVNVMKTGFNLLWSLSRHYESGHYESGVKAGCCNRKDQVTKINPRKN